MEGLIQFVRNRFSGLADPNKAQGMAAYMKTDMPFSGFRNSSGYHVVDPGAHSDERFAPLS